MPELILKQSGIYQIVNTVNGKCYVGSSVNITGRWGQHRHLLRANKHKNQKFQNAWSKHGESAFEFVILELCQESELIVTEQRYIDRIGCVASGYNISDQAGRERAGVRHTPESIERMSVARRGKTVGPEQRVKLSVAFKGRVFSEEWKAKISAAKTGKKRPPITDQARANYIAAAKLRPPKSAEHRANLSTSSMGKVMSVEARAKMSIAQRKRYAK